LLSELVLENFRCFKHHVIPLREKTVIVGRNNAGKSTIAEALRLVSLVVDRYRSLTYKPPPHWLEIHKNARGVAPSLDNQDFNFEKIFHRYNPPPATVVAKFSNRANITVYVGPESAIHAVLRTPSGKIVDGKSAAERLALPTLGILPQVGPVPAKEIILSPDYVLKTLSSTLSSLHFRNEINLLYKPFFSEFKRISDSTWSGLAIQELIGQGKERGEPLQLMVRNDDFVADVSWMGHGLQMWLQTMWFLSRCKGYETIILDEPDVYMHADLQRKLIRFVRNRHPQVIIATHSVEIMAEVEPEDVLIVDKDRQQAKFATDMPELQRIINGIGGVHNLQLARFANAHKCLFVEGDDLVLLKKLHNTLFPDSQHPIDAVANISIGGWSGWKSVIGSSWLVEQTGVEVSTYCLLDSDYHLEEEVGGRVQEADNNQIRLHIWKRKELENYLLVPDAVQRLIVKFSSKKKNLPGAQQVREAMIRIAEAMKQEVIDSFAQEFRLAQPRLAVQNWNESARKLVERSWGSFAGKISLVGGKSMLAELNKWSQAEFAASFTNARLAAELLREEIDGEVVQFLQAFEDNEPL
jgi:energy-coupling factor transporter ATP-binding protein EcfA2